MKTVGLFPVTPDIDLSETTQVLTLGFSWIHTEAVAALSQYDFDGENTDSESQDPPPSVSGAQLRWLDPNVVWAHPISESPSLASYQDIIEQLSKSFVAVVADFSGFEARGEHQSGASLCDAIILVAKQSRTRENVLVRVAEDFDRKQIFGVLLVE